MKALFLALLLVAPLAHAEITECHLREHTYEPESFVSPVGVKLRDDGYVCKEKVGTATRKYVEVEGNHSKLEVVTTCEPGQAEETCKLEILPKPATRFGDLMRFKLINVYNWDQEANNVVINGGDALIKYANSLDAVYTKVLADCSHFKNLTHKDSFTWVGRISNDGIIAYSMVEPENRVSKCVLEKLDHRKVTAPPNSPVLPSYELDGGFPVSFPGQIIGGK